MAKNLKLNIKNAQIAQAINLGSIKSKLAKKKVDAEGEESKAVDLKEKKAPEKKAAEKIVSEKPLSEERKEDAPKVKARSKSAFAETHSAEAPISAIPESLENAAAASKESAAAESFDSEITALSQDKEIEEIKVATEELTSLPQEQLDIKEKEHLVYVKPAEIESTAPDVIESSEMTSKPAIVKEVPPPPPPPVVKEKLGPTGRHIKDLIPPRPTPSRPPQQGFRPGMQEAPRAKTAAAEQTESDKSKVKPRFKTGEEPSAASEGEGDKLKKTAKGSKFREFRDLKPAKKQESSRFDVRDRQGLRASEEEHEWRKKRSKGMKGFQEDVAHVRPTSLKIRLPIIIKDLASEMKLKASELIGKLFLQGIIVTLNDILEDETIVQLLGHEFGCEITIDTSEAERIRITDKTIKEEVASTPDELIVRPPVVAFMGHVDHGKTSLIDAIRKSNRAAGEAGAITQHIGAFKCHTAVGDLTILDTPGHEAFSAMRARGADVTDIVVLVVAGDEGIRQQTTEAIQHAKAAGVTIVVAINKSDKPNFNPENVYRQLAEQELLPEIWGGQTITVNCSAVTKEGITQLLEMLALQAEVLELRANSKMRARGRVIESEMHKGMGASATILVQNGTLHLGDSIVFEHYFGKIKTMRDEHDKPMTEAGPSTPAVITGLSGLPAAGQEFIAVKNEKEAREISEARLLGQRQVNLQQKKKLSMDNLLQQASETGKKILNIVLRADVQGSLEALKVALLKIESQKADINIIFSGVGEISESDVQLAAASKAVIIGFHTQLEGHADSLIKELGVEVRLHDIIYHAIDDVKALMAGLLDKIPQETERGKAEVKATFKSSQVGIIAGCQVIEGTIARNNLLRLKREGQEVWRGNISSLKRVKEDVREVQKGMECGILLSNFNDVKEGDILEAFEITYLTQEL